MARPSPQSPPSWSDWARHFGLEPPDQPADLSFSPLSAAIDAAVSESGFVLGQASLIDEALTNGQLVVACPRWMRFPEPYALAWNPASLDRPFGREFRSFIVQAAQKLRKAARS